MRLTSVMVAALCAGLMVAMAGAQTAAPLRINAVATRQAISGHMQIATVTDLPAGVKWASVTIAILDTNNTTLSTWKAPQTLLSATTLTATFLQAPGSYRLRVTAIDAARRTATAECDVTATLTPIAGGLSVSPIAFGLDGHPFQPRREFTTEPQALARFELYGGKTGMAVSVTMELAAAADTPAIAKLIPTITPTPEPDRFIVTAPVDLSALKAGRYMVRVVAGVDGQPATTFSGTFELGQLKSGINSSN